MTTQENYTPPVDQLLKIGEPGWLAPIDKWLDYPQQFGLSQRDIPQLLKLAGDQDLYYKDFEDPDDPAQWGPVHAWRALGQLEAVDAVDTLLKTLEWEGEDYAINEIPKVMALIGAGAIPALARAIRRDYEAYSATASASIDALEQIATRHPQTREEVIALLIGQLYNFGDNDPAINGFLINSLTNLKAETALPLIEEAFDEETVDETIIRWHTVQYEFGLISQEEHDRLEEEFRAFWRAQEATRWPSGSSGTGTGSKTTPGVKKQKARAKAKRKIEKASRKKNRKKK